MKLEELLLSNNLDYVCAVLDILEIEYEMITETVVKFKNIKDILKLKKYIPECDIFSSPEVYSKTGYKNLKFYNAKKYINNKLELDLSFMIYASNNFQAYSDNYAEARFIIRIY